MLMSSVSKLRNISKVSYVLSNMSKVSRCYASNCSEIRSKLSNISKLSKLSNVSRNLSNMNEVSRYCASSISYSRVS